MAKPSRKLTDCERLVREQTLRVGDTVTAPKCGIDTEKIAGFFVYPNGSDLYAKFESGGYWLASRLKKVEVPNA